MKKVNYIILVFSLLLLACKKEGGLQKIDGTIYKNCDNEPVANKTFRVRGVRSTFTTGFDYYDLGEVTTDAQGNFRHVYETEVDLTEVQLLRNGKEYLRIYDRDKTGISYYETGIVTHKMVLKVADTLSNLDTLFFSGFLFDYIVGPFENNQTIIFKTAPNIGGGRGLLIGGSRGESYWWWGLGTEEFLKVKFDPMFHVPPNVIRGIPQKLCGTGGDVVIDLTGYNS